MREADAPQADEPAPRMVAVADDNASGRRIYQQGHELIARPWSECPELAQDLDVARTQGLPAGMKADAAPEELRKNLSPYALDALGLRDVAFARGLEDVPQLDDVVTGSPGAVVIPSEPLPEGTKGDDTLDDPGAGSVDPPADLE